MKNLNFLTVLICLQAVNAGAETIQLSTYYPSPYGIYNRLRLVPQNSLPDPCLVGTIYVNQEGQLQYCTGEKGKGSWGTLGTITGKQPKSLRIVRGSVEVSADKPVDITFEMPFTNLPLIQIYAEVSITTKEGSVKSLVDYTSKVVIFDVSINGYKINYLGDEKIKLFWLAAGN